MWVIDTNAARMRIKRVSEWRTKGMRFGRMRQSIVMTAASANIPYTKNMPTSYTGMLERIISSTGLLAFRVAKNVAHTLTTKLARNKTIESGAEKRKCWSNQ